MNENRLSGSLIEPVTLQNAPMPEALGWLLFLLLLARYPVQTLIGLAAIFVVAWVFRKPSGDTSTSRGNAMTVTPAAMDARTADGRFPLLNEDWAGEIVLAIDDEEVPDVIRVHGARFKNPARYVIDLGHGEYLLYGSDGELLDLCYLR